MSGAKTTLRALVTRYQAGRIHLAPGTLDVDAMIVTRIAKTDLLDTNLADIKTSHLRAFFASIHIHYSKSASDKFLVIFSKNLRPGRG